MEPMEMMQKIDDELFQPNASFYELNYVDFNHFDFDRFFAS